MQSSKINGSWQKLITKNEDSSLIWRLRKNHTINNYRNTIIFYGGQPLTPPHLILKEDIEEAPEEKEISSPINFHHYIHKLDHIGKQWIQYPLSIPSIGTGIMGSTTENISQHGSIMINNLIFIFGGLNYSTKLMRPSQLWTINADSLAMKRIEVKGILPSPRCKPILSIINKTNILLYGGYYQEEYLNEFYFYKIQLKTWLKLEDTHQYIIPKLINPCLSGVGENQLYIYGGYRQIAIDTEIQRIPNFQLYKFKIIGKTVSLKPDLQIKRVLHNLDEIEASSGQMFTYAEKYLVLLSHNKETGRLKSTWFFNPQNALWTQVKQSNLDNQNPIKSTASLISVGDKIYACNQNIFQLTLDQSCLFRDIRQTSESVEIQNCSICENENFSYSAPKKMLKKQFQTYLEPLSFAYSAIGLLVDNCIMAKAEVCNLLFTYASTSSSSERSIIIEDNGQPSNIWGDNLQNFPNVINSLYAGCLDRLFSEQDYKQQSKHSFKDIEKKYKQKQKQLLTFQKQQKRDSMNPNYNMGIGTNTNSIKTQKDYEKQLLEIMEKKKHLEFKNKLQGIKTSQSNFSSNWKLGGLRLGDLIIYGSKEKQTEQNNINFREDRQIKRFALIHLETIKDENQHQQQYYVCYSYSLENGTVSHPSMEADMKYISKQYRKELKLINQKLKLMNNVVYVSNLRKQKQQQEQNNIQHLLSTELHYRKKFNDIYLGSTTLLNSHDTKPGINVADFCDVSLKSYLSLLYTRNEDMRISISVRDVPLQQISSQRFLPVIDKLNKNKRIFSVDQCLDFECEIVQVYYIPELTLEESHSKFDYSFINNGVLIYNNGRLISRYKIPLGQLLHYDQPDLKKTDINKSKLFGVIQLNTNFAINVYKTDFLYGTALEPLYSRLNFVYEYFKKNFNLEKVRGKNRKQELSSNQKPKKKTKSQC